MLSKAKLKNFRVENCYSRASILWKFGAGASVFGVWGLPRSATALPTHPLNTDPLNTTHMIPIHLMPSTPYLPTQYHPLNTDPLNTHTLNTHPCNTIHSLPAHSIPIHSIPNLNSNLHLLKPLPIHYPPT